MPLLYVVIIISVVVTGCQSLRYEEPMAGPLARVRFVAETKNVTVLRMYDDTHCTTNETEWMRFREGFILRSTPKVLGMPLWRHHKNAAKEVFVEANKLLYGLFVGSVRGNSSRNRFLSRLTESAELLNGVSSCPIFHGRPSI